MGGALVPVSTGRLERHLKALTDAGGADGDIIMAVSAGCVIMKCNGTQGCIYHDTCPFCTGVFQDLDAPTGEACPLEISYMYTFYNGYRNEMNPKGTNFSLMSLIKEMCVLEINLMRAERMLSTDGALVEVITVGIDKGTGETISRPEMSAKAQTWRMLQRDKIKLFEQMGLTPKAKAQIGSTMSKDPSTFAAELVSYFETLEKKRKHKEVDVIDVTTRPDGDNILEEPVKASIPESTGEASTQAPELIDREVSEEPATERDEGPQQDYCGNPPPF